MCLWLPTTSNYLVISGNTLMQTTLLLFINKFVFFSSCWLLPWHLLVIYFFWEALGSQKLLLRRLPYFKKSSVYFCKTVSSVKQKVLDICKESENKDIKWLIMEFISKGKWKVYSIFLEVDGKACFQEHWVSLRIFKVSEQIVTSNV